MTSKQNEIAQRFEDGAALYKSGNYRAANLMFCKAMEASDVPSIKILDARSATREKLGDSKGAYEDAMKMTQLYSTNVRSYLRLGKVFELVLKWNKALALYRHGISKVNQKMEMRILEERLEKAEKMMSVSSKEKYFDPCHKLPAELMIYILQYLPFEKLVQCQQVSKSWRRLMTSTVELWRHLDFSKARKSIDTRALERLLKSSKMKCFQITLDRDILSKPHDLKHLLRSCRMTLVSLNTFRLPAPPDVLYALHQLTELSIWSRITPVEVRRILKECYYLRTLQLYDIKTGEEWPPISRCNSMPSLIKILLIKGQASQRLCRFVAINDWSFLFPFCERLTLIGSWYKDGLPLVLTQHLENLQALHLLSPDLCTLSIHVGSKLSSLRMDSILPDLSETRFLDSISQLTKLEIINCDMKDAATIKIVSCCADKLRYIDLHKNKRMMNSEILWVMLHCPDLRTVIMSDISSVTDDVLAAMSTLEYLTYVDVSNCTSITGAGFLKLIRSPFKTLRHVSIKECDRVSSDSVDYARSLGIIVEYSFQSLQALKRRKVG